MRKFTITLKRLGQDDTITHITAKSMHAAKIQASKLYPWMKGQWGKHPVNSWRKGLGSALGPILKVEETPKEKS